MGTFFRMGGGLGMCRVPINCPPSSAPPEPMYLTDESGNRLVDPEGNLITEG
jgi:hypothetical protein